MQPLVFPNFWMPLRLVFRPKVYEENVHLLPGSAWARRKSSETGPFRKAKIPNPAGMFDAIQNVTYLPEVPSGCKPHSFQRNLRAFVL